nr:MAG TPA: hypothetical protein [Caudoviricetes sp.]
MPCAPPGLVKRGTRGIIRIASGTIVRQTSSTSPALRQGGRYVYSH